MIDFVPWVGSLIVRKWRWAAVNFSDFPTQISSIVDYIFLLQGLNLKRTILLVSSIWNWLIYFSHWILIVQECPNAVIIDKFLCSDSCFFINTDLTCSIKVAVEKILLFKEYWPKKAVNSFSSLESWWNTIARIVCDMGSFRFWNSCFSKTTDFIFSVKVSI